VFIAVAVTVGVLLTIVTGSDPGFLLGVLVVAGAVAASLAVDARRAYLIIPAPALAYLAAAILAGLIHDKAADSSHTLLALNAARWVASGFLGMVAATALAAAITVTRWLRTNRALGQPAVGPRPPAHDRRRAPAGGRAARTQEPRRRD